MSGADEWEREGLALRAAGYDADLKFGLPVLASCRECGAFHDPHAENERAWDQPARCHDAKDPADPRAHGRALETLDSRGYPERLREVQPPPFWCPRRPAIRTLSERA